MAEEGTPLVTQATSPLITEPESLSSEAMKAADASLMARIGASTAPSSSPFNTRIGASTSRRRGRPPGSKNKPKIDPVTGEVVTTIRRTNTTSREPTPEEERKRKLEDKKKRAKEWENRIVSDVNDIIMDALIGVGIPPNFLYVNPPPAKIEQSNFTALGQRISIKRTHAKVWGNTLAEFEASDYGGRVSDALVGDSPIRLLILGLLSLGMAGQYVRGLLQLKEQFQPFIEAAQANKKAQQAAQHSSNNGPTGGIHNAAAANPGGLG
jgi:hypothetical protein